MAIDRKNILGTRIKEWRKQKKLTQEDLAFKIGRSTEAVSMLERGINNPTPETIDAISKVLNIPVHEFYKTETSDIRNKRQEMIDKAVGIIYGLEEKELEKALGILEVLK